MSSTTSHNLRFIRSITTLIFDEVQDIRSRSGDFDRLLSNTFVAPGMIYAIGDNVPPAVARLNYRSIHGHSSLDLSCVSAQIVTHFDGEFCDKLDLIKTYCLEREKILEDDLMRIGVKVRYVGFTVTSQLSVGDKNKAVTALIQSFFKSNALLGKPNAFGTAFKMTFIEDNKYFINFHVSDFTAFTMQLAIPGKDSAPVRIVNPSMRDFVEAGSGIEVTLDCNNRYLYDAVDKDGHCADDFKKILDWSDEYQRRVTSGGYLNV